MTAKLKRDRAGTRSARHIARHRIKSALKTLDRKNTSDGSIHAARKELKKARAALRLLRDALGESTYKRENTALRDAARPLSAVRDGRVLLDVLSSLAKYYGSPAAALQLTKFQRILSRRRTQLRAKVLNKSGPLRGTRKTLHQVRSRSDRWHVGRHGWSILGAGLKRTYSKGRQALQQVRIQPANERLHEWRKQAKYFWYQLQMLEPLRPGPLGELADETHKLADFLGDDHDLAVLREQAEGARAVFPTAASQRALVALIERRRERLQEKALRLAQRLYAEKPAAFNTRLGNYWRNGHRS
ncbi:MAG: CHAD domain-containing protein [Steroidobacteraceae bacterium]